MCGFFAFSTGLSSREIADLFNLDTLPHSMADIQSLKFYPKSKIPTISKNSPNSLVMRYWSLIPSWWQKELSDLTFSTFNARAEDIVQKPTYRTAWNNCQRCLIPASWFYEFQALKTDAKTVRVPYRVEEQNCAIITLAGIYDSWKSPSGELIESVSIITTQSAGLLAKIHNRQPVIIEKNQRELWLDKKTSPEEATAMISSVLDLQITEIDHQFNKSFGTNVTNLMVHHFYK